MRKVIEACQAAGIIYGKSVAEIFLCFHYAALAHIFHRRTADNIRKKLSEQAIAFSEVYNDIQKYKSEIIRVYVNLYTEKGL